MNTELIEILKALPELNTNGAESKQAKLLSAVDKIMQCYFHQFINDGLRNMHELKGVKATEALIADYFSYTTNIEMPPAPSSDDVWIFGYGSLVWKADFAFIDRRRGYICGYRRLFYQNSTDHRGTPAKPGRVVTLLPGDLQQHRVYGVAYRIACADAALVLNHLDYRERNGYQRCDLEFHEMTEHANNTSRPFLVTMYIATPDNAAYAGDKSHPQAIAQQMFCSAGCSGPNRDYFFNLVSAMTGLFPHIVDEHLNEIAAQLERLIAVEEPIILRQALQREIEQIVVDYACSRRNHNSEAEEFALRALERLLVFVQTPGSREALLAKETTADIY